MFEDVQTGISLKLVGNKRRIDIVKETTNHGVLNKKTTGLEIAKQQWGLILNQW